jgi:uncharacterized protein YkwD
VLRQRRTVDGQRMAPIVKLLACAVLSCIALPLPASASAATCANADLVPDASNIAGAKTATLCLLNAERSARGLSRLTSDGQLGKAAQRYSASMVRQRFFDHVSPSGSTLDSRVRRGTSYLRGGVRGWSLGENIAWGAGDHRSWMRSSGHRRNILDRRFRHIGIGVATGAPGDVQGQPAATYTTDFGSRVRG